MARTRSLRHAISFRMKGLIVAAAIVVATIAGYAAPTVQVEAAPSHCHVLDMVDWWVLTGQISEYGGMYCHH